ncbi:MAG TPA: sensor histidine kinase [Lachnospiraceae bacterium]|nr:sensor histidine kinase [Lachnospiraceae bacterium]
MRVSLKAKLRFMIFIMLVPLSFFALYLMYRMGTYSDYYDVIYKNIANANKLGQEFKEKFDYSLYRIVIGSSSFEEEKPYEQLDMATELVTKLRQGSVRNENLITTKKMLGFLDSLRNSSGIIEENLKKDGPKYDDNNKILDNDIYGTTTLVIENAQQYVYYETLQMKTVRDDFTKEIRNTLNFGMLMLLVLVAIIIIVTEVITKSITNPIRKLCSATKQVEKGDFTTRAELTSADEITTLTLSFNHMIEKIGTLVDDVRMEQVNLRKAELKLLQAQINPHFLYNTFDTIIWLAEDRRHEEVVHMVSALSDFFRTSLSKGKDYITVQEEKLHVESYLKIQQIRYKDILEYVIDIPEELERYIVLKLILQPIVENALYHGIKNKRGMGRILVRAEFKLGNIFFYVIDNGIGMNENVQKRVYRLLEGNERELQESQSGFGLANVNERIKLNYGKDYGLSFSSEYNSGTTMVIKIPAVMELDE